MASLAGAASAEASIKRLSTLFSSLQDSRNDADYDYPRELFSRTGALLLIDNAREAINLLTVMDEDARRRLAVELLVARAR